MENVNHAKKGFHKCCMSSKGISRRRNESKAYCNTSKPQRQRRIRCCLVAKHIKDIKRTKLHEILYNLGKSYLTERTAIFTNSSTQTEREVAKGCPQGSCCGPGFWNIQYNSLLNLEFGKRTKIISYSDDLLIAVKAETVREAKNYANIEISKITKW